MILKAGIDFSLANTQIPRIRVTIQTIPPTRKKDITSPIIETISRIIVICMKGASLFCAYFTKIPLI